MRKAKRLRPELYARAAAYYDEQFRAEHDTRVSVDAAADPTASFTSELAGLFTDNDAHRRFGYFLGRFIYLADAADDLEKDLKRGCFNPFIRAYGVTPENLRAKAPACLEALELTAAQTVESFRACGLTSYGAVTENVVGLGLFAQIDRIKSKYEEEKS